MRDIRGDLQERASVVEQQINVAQDQFEKLIEQLKREHDGRANGLKAELDAVNRVIEIEHRRLGSTTSAPKSHLRQPLADFLVRKLGEAASMSSEDLGRLAVQEGYFANADSAQQGVHSTLMHVVKTGQIQQLPNARFAIVAGTRLRRAV
jgi:cell division septum initiation protein DivIVA